MIYFAYGSNTNPDVMLSRMPDAVYRGIYTLKGWELRFAGHSRNHPKYGVLDIKPNKEKEVHGVLWEIPNKEVAYLDHEEGYKYHHFTFYLDSGEKAYSYSMMEGIEGNKPHREYVKLVLKGYLKYGLSIKDIEEAYRKIVV